MRRRIKELECLEAGKITKGDAFDSVVMSIGGHIRDLVNEITDPDDRYAWRK